MQPFTQFFKKFDDDHYLTLQSRMLITGRHDAIAKEVGCHPSKIGQYSNGTFHVPAFRLALISAAQHEWSFARFIFDRAGVLLLPHQPAVLSLNPLRLLALLVQTFGRILTLGEKIQNEQILSDEEMQNLEEDVETLKAAGDALVNKARKRRAQKKDPRAKQEKDQE